MMDLATLPEIQSYLTTGVSVHGTGFQSDLWLGNLAIVAFVVWCFRSGGKKALILALIPAALLAMATPEANASRYPDYQPGPYVPHPSDFPSSSQRIPFDGMDITPLLVFGALLWVATSGKQPEKSKPKKPSKPESDPMADMMAAMLRNKKALIPVVPLLAMAPAIANAAGPLPALESGPVVGWALVGLFAAFMGLRALADRRMALALALTVVAVVGLSKAAPAFIFESDGERAVKEANAERIRLEAQAAFQREMALLRSQGHAAPPANRLPTVAFWLLFGIAALAVGWAYIENRWREHREAEIRLLRQRLDIAERRQPRFPALPHYESKTNDWKFDR
ncbi:MAG: hypothetical protein ACLFQQ_23585 [Desulfococcaceae bacterium]